VCYFMCYQLQGMDIEQWWNDTDSVQKLKNSEKISALVP